MNKRRGISLIVLIITILVMIILAGVVVVSLQKNNPIPKAKEAVFKTDIAQYKTELASELSKKYLKNPAFKKDTLNEIEYEKIKQYIKSFNRKYENILVIREGEITLNSWNSPFEYQLLGSYIQPKIEKELGRKLEVTDFFYELMIPNTNNKTYLYNYENNLIVEVDKSKLAKRQAVWWWRETGENYEYFVNDTKRAQLMDFLKEEGITDIYIDYGADNFKNNPDFIRKIVKEAYDRNIATEVLWGSVNYIRDDKFQSGVVDKFELVENYNKSSKYNEKIKGIHYDIEIHTRDQITDIVPWKYSNSESEKISNRKVGFVNLVSKAYSVAKSKNLSIAFDVPPLHYAATTVIYNGEEKSLLEFIAKNSDYMSLMAYKNDAVKLFRYVCLPSDTEYDKSSGRLSYTEYLNESTGKMSGTKYFEDGTLRNTASAYELALKHRKNIMVGVVINSENTRDDFGPLGKTRMKEVLNEFSGIISDPQKDIVVGSRSLKEQSITKCNFKNVPFDHYFFGYHKAIELMQMTK